jgi:hypothetical protein
MRIVVCTGMLGMVKVGCVSRQEHAGMSGWWSEFREEWRRGSVRVCRP